MVGFPNKPMGFPTKNDHFEVFWGYHHLRKHSYGLGFVEGDFVLLVFTLSETNIAPQNDGQGVYFVPWDSSPSKRPLG